MVKGYNAVLFSCKWMAYNDNFPCWHHRDSTTGPLNQHQMCAFLVATFLLQFHGHLPALAQVISSDLRFCLKHQLQCVTLSYHSINTFDFLRDEAHRNEWDIMSNGGPVQSIANLAEGQDRGNAVTIQTM
ncbi:hypothetical protein F0562_027088 [Nyssa sinensis]|uniref:HD-Zip IV C-terminal domain-containing protein n=1 Tax=Nyssa sinensis TaxID=561372 RepID=A0A5J5B4E9_9ASTE|nr:hypothetical protein F0562_027088 [Nyssa sinensis]